MLVSWSRTQKSRQRARPYPQKDEHKQWYETSNTARLEKVNRRQYRPRKKGERIIIVAELPPLLTGICPHPFTNQQRHDAIGKRFNNRIAAACYHRKNDEVNTNRNERDLPRFADRRRHSHAEV